MTTDEDQRWVDFYSNNFRFTKSIEIGRPNQEKDNNLTLGNSIVSTCKQCYKLICYNINSICIHCYKESIPLQKSEHQKIVERLAKKLNKKIK